MSIASQAALDFIYASSATQLARLAKGTALQAIRMNSGASGYEFFTPFGGEKLRSIQGSTTTTTNPTTLDSFSVSGLTALDSLLYVVWARAVTQACANIKVYNATDAVDLGETSTINAGATNVMTMWGRQSHQGSTVAMFGGLKTGTAIAVDDNFETPTVANWQGTWTSELRHTGLTAGGTLYWHLLVLKFAGQ